MNLSRCRNECIYCAERDALYSILFVIMRTFFGNLGGDRQHMERRKEFVNHLFLFYSRACPKLIDSHSGNRRDFLFQQIPKELDCDTLSTQYPDQHITIDQMPSHSSKPSAPFSGG